jgi:hypothetical protein
MSSRGGNRLLPLGLIAALAGCTPAAVEVDRISAAIIDGTPNPGDPAVVSLLAFKDNVGSRCTATVISPHMLLTAGHCIQETTGFSYTVNPGPIDTQGARSDFLAVRTVAYDMLFNPRDPSLGHDLGVVVLDVPIAVPALPMNRQALVNVVGRSGRYLGYGRADAGAEASAGVKRSFSAPIAQANDHYLRVSPDGHGACSGDSGGPLLMDLGAGEVIIGVVSFGDDASCGKSSFFQRLDTQLAWVDEQMRMWDPLYAPPLPDGGAPPPHPTDDGGRDAQTAPPPSPPDAAPELPAAPDAAATTAPSSSGGCAMGGQRRRGGTTLLVVAAGFCLINRSRLFGRRR